MNTTKTVTVGVQSLNNQNAITSKEYNLDVSIPEKNAKLIVAIMSDMGCTVSDSTASAIASDFLAATDVKMIYNINTRDAGTVL